MGLRRETSIEDGMRTGALIEAAEAAFEGQPLPPTEFEVVVTEALLTDRSFLTYPPAGHDYPRRG
ncbi:hypothetical protein [Streptomyces sp. NPDC005732]|uniref:hypothetical protein n=1 Tax=Streptomyces sp. NPDC005732 TaxID=3157057 RepID=UPI0033D02D6E